MAITLNLRPEVEAGLIAQAQANGMSLEEYLLSIIEGAAFTSRTISPEEHKEIPTREAAVQGMLEFGEKYHLSLGEPETCTLLHQGHPFLMAAFVLDASVAVSRCFPGDPLEDTVYSRQVLKQPASGDALESKSGHLRLPTLFLFPT